MRRGPRLCLPLLCLPLLCLLAWACDDGSDPAGAGGVGGESGSDMRVPVGTVCDVEALVAQCPPGSLPIIDEVASRDCASSLELTDDNGAVTGVCRVVESCQFICNFSDPCRCGIDRITIEGVFCAECVTACGDAVCEGGEDPVTCPIDCAERCPPDAERCNGNDREVCEDNGRWTRLTCRSDQRCVFEADPRLAGLSLCDTVVSQGGGAFGGLGRWHPVEVDDYDAVRFAAGNIAFAPFVFLDDGRLLGLSGTTFVAALPGEAAEPLPADAPTSLPELFGLHATTGLREIYAISQTRVAGGFQVWDTLTGGTRFLEDFGGFPTGEMFAQVTAGPWAISPDGSTVAHALSVPFGEQARVTIITWDAATGRVRRLLRFRELDTGVPADALPLGLAFSADGATLVAAYPKPEGSLLVIWDVEARRFARLFASALTPVQRGVNRLVGSRAGDDRLIWSVGDDTEVWDLSAERRLRAFDRLAGEAAFTPDGASVIIGDVQYSVGDGSVERMLPRAGRVLFDPRVPRMLIDTVIFGTGD